MHLAEPNFTWGLGSGSASWANSPNSYLKLEPLESNLNGQGQCLELRAGVTVNANAKTK